ncbi:MAG: wax ester/triacylglycerol synthase family O-acyltransferase [Caldilineales bacterium]|nr:wax ester/triacylglycerol synthase family O-acyltransferase [Caldilineales bacterium]
MSNVDAAWLHMEKPNNLMMITGLFIFDQPVDFERLKQVLNQRLVRLDRFRQRVVEPRLGLGSPRWEFDPHFDIANHLHRIALPPPGDQAALQDLVSDLASTPLDYSKPLWQYHLVDGVGQGSALVCRLHHCIADGIALMRVLLTLTDDAPDAQWRPPEDEREKHSRNPLRVILSPAAAAVGATRRVTGAVVSTGAELLTNPSRALEWARLGTDTTMALGRLLLLPPDPKTILKGPLGVPKRAAWSQSIPLPTIKAIGRATGATVNDVLLSAVAGALHRYLVGRGQPVHGLSIRAFMPVNLRQDTPKIELGNKFGLVIVSLPVGIADHLDRLFVLKRHVDDLKNSPEAVVAFSILNAIGMAPTEIENVVVNIFGLKGTAVMTNVPGPRHPIYLAGARVSQLMFWVPQSGRMGVGVSIFSYNNQVWLGVITDRGLVPDPDTIVAHFHDVVDEMYQLVLQAQQEGGAPEAPSADEKPEATPPAPPPEVSAPAPAEPSAAAVRHDAAEAIPPAPTDSPLLRIRGIGPTFAARLTAGGIASLEALAASTPEQVAAVVQAPDWRRPDYRSWIEQAKALVGGQRAGG